MINNIVTFTDLETNNGILPNVKTNGNHVAKINDKIFLDHFSKGPYTYVRRT